MTVIYLVRHCHSSGPAPDALLTEIGLAQAQTLARRMTGAGIERIVSSSYRRAVQTAEPLASQLGIPVETDDRLIERELGLGKREDWLERLAETYHDFDLRFDGSETNREAQQRGMAALQDIITADRTTMVVTHGGMLSLLLNYFDKEFGFKEWQALSNPDVYRLEINQNRPVLERTWPWLGS